MTNNHHHAVNDLFSSLNSSPSTPQLNSGNNSPNLINFDDEADFSYHNYTTATTNHNTNTNKPLMVFDRFYDSSSDDGGATGSSGGDNLLVQAAGNRLDYMMQYLDKKLLTVDEKDNDIDVKQALPEFIGSGGGLGMFKLPFRGAVHPNRPPNIEFRPHPLRETQFGCFLRLLEGNGDGRQLWAGSECGVRVWDVKDMYNEGEVEVRFCESVRTSPTLCLVVDDGNKVVWSGHKDGKIRCWKMLEVFVEGDNCFKECVSWQAHRGPVLYMVVSSYGNVSCTCEF